MTTPNTSGWLLRRYVDEFFIPVKLASGLLSKRSARGYRSLLNLFYEFAGDSVRCNSIDEDLLVRFTARLIENGYSQIYARHAREATRSVLHHWNPEVFVDRRGIYGNHGNGSGEIFPFIDADIAGSLEQIFKDDYLPERTSISSPATVRQYARVLRLFTAYLGRTAGPCHLTDRIVGKFLRWLVEVQGVKAVTANGYVKQLKALWNWLAKKRVVDRFPTIDKLKQSDPLPKAWTRDDLVKLLAACRKQTGRLLGISAAEFWVAFHYVLFDTGERTGAMFALRWEWLDMRKGHLSVPGEFRKGRQQPMLYRLKQPTIDALRNIRSPRRENIFVGSEVSDHRQRHAFYKRYKALLDDAGLPYVPHKCGPQKMRRTFASFIEAAGGNATRALKHRDRRVTEDSYLDPSITEVESENTKLFPLEEAGE